MTVERHAILAKLNTGNCETFCTVLVDSHSEEENEQTGSAGKKTYIYIYIY